MSYQSFLDKKAVLDNPTGFDCDHEWSWLFPFQRVIVRWALRRGRAAVFAATGLGKTRMQLTWASEVARHTGKQVLILAPLAVSKQTIREANDIGIGAGDIESGADIIVTNYHKLHRLDVSKFAGVALDESGILKNHVGATSQSIREAFAQTPFRSAWSATPAPNDWMEIGTHAEFVGSMSRAEMLAMFFVHDGGGTNLWRLKGHAEGKFYQWLCSWAMAIDMPSDLGFDDGGYVLPPLRFHEHFVDNAQPLEGQLFAVPAEGLQERRQARAESIDDRIETAAGLVGEGQLLVWCGLNEEANRIARTIGAENVQGSDSDERKEEVLLGFANGTVQRLVSKPSIAGHGMNWQKCHRMIFLGLSDSYEQLYQAVRRCWRFGQTEPVDVHIVLSTKEKSVLDNIKRKEELMISMRSGMVRNMAPHMDLGATKRTRMENKNDEASGDGWDLKLGDCVDRVKEIASDSVHYSIFSPPFASLYTYSNSERDMGNCKSHGEFYEHFRFLVGELHRVIMPGRLVSFHCMNLPSIKERDGFIGVRDFRGEMIRLFNDAGFIFHSEVCIWKDPVTAMQRTKAIGLLHKQLVKDSCLSRQGIPDYLVTMRKRGDNPERVGGELAEYVGTESEPTGDRKSIAIWQRYASPVWMDVNPSDTLQYRSARENNDERHICPLQLQVIHRGLQLWTNPGDLVLSPFAGIGSEGFEAVKMGRRFLGIELKESYFKAACNNLRLAESESMGELFAGAV